MSGASRQRAGQEGFTLIEVMVTLVTLVILLIGLGATGGVASRTMAVTERRGEATERVHRFFQRINDFTRSGVLSTYEVLSTEADVEAGRAVEVGEWIDPVDGEPRFAVRFCSADGNLAMNATSITPPIELHFDVDSAEDPAANPGAVAGSDDDADGLIDEGRIEMTYEGVSAAMVSGIEYCSVTIDGFLMTVQIRTARRGEKDLQFVFEQVFTLRNN